MKIDPAALAQLVVRLEVSGFVRVVRRAHAATPLGMGFGKTRFSSPSNAFQLLYIAQDSRTAIAEAIIRDRFQYRTKRELLRIEFDHYSITEVQNLKPLTLIDMRTDGAMLLGVPTDAVRSRAHNAGRVFSQRLFDNTQADGIVYLSRLTGQTCVAVYDRAVLSKLLAPMAIDLPRLSSLVADMQALQVTLIG